ncbi:unnamed protein product, partial [Vitis vinifera]
MFLNPLNCVVFDCNLSRLPRIEWILVLKYERSTINLFRTDTKLPRTSSTSTTTTICCPKSLLLSLTVELSKSFGDGFLVYHLDLMAIDFPLFDCFKDGGPSSHPKAGGFEFDLQSTCMQKLEKKNQTNVERTKKRPLRFTYMICGVETSRVERASFSLHSYAGCLLLSLKPNSLGFKCSVYSSKSAKPIVHFSSASN